MQQKGIEYFKIMSQLLNFSGDLKILRVLLLKKSTHRPGIKNYFSKLINANSMFLYTENVFPFWPNIYKTYIKEHVKSLVHSC